MDREAIKTHHPPNHTPTHTHIHQFRTAGSGIPRSVISPSRKGSPAGVRGFDSGTCPAPAPKPAGPWRTAARGHPGPAPPLGLRPARSPPPRCPERAEKAEVGVSAAGARAPGGPGSQLKRPSGRQIGVQAASTRSEEPWRSRVVLPAGVGGPADESGESSDVSSRRPRPHPRGWERRPLLSGSSQVGVAASRPLASQRLGTPPPLPSPLLPLPAGTSSPPLTPSASGNPAPPSLALPPFTPRIPLSRKGNCLRDFPVPRSCYQLFIKKEKQNKTQTL